MSQADLQYLAAATRGIEHLLHARAAEPLRPSGLSPELQSFAEAFDRLLEQLVALRQLAITLANGDLSYEPPPRSHLLDPLKALQGNLRHLTWQAQRIAAGDLDQQVDFLGDFSEAFNRMIQGLREKRIAEENVRYLSLHDALTGLYNRAYFNEELERLSTSQDYPVSFLIADVDGLKTVNDTHGHLAGDLLIQKAARVLEHSVRVEDAVVRLGGDELAVILYRTDEDAAAAVMACIRDSLGDYSRRGPFPPISLSIGAATAHEASSLERALHEADERMYQQKMGRRQQRERGAPSSGTLAAQSRQP